jgi:hypothetical protein
VIDTRGSGPAVRGPGPGEFRQSVMRVDSETSASAWPLGRVRSMQAFHTTSKVSSNGALVITGLPFGAGEEVEVTVESKSTTRGQIFRTPLAGIPVEYVDPFNPAVPPEEWEAMNNASS